MRAKVIFTAVLLAAIFLLISCRTQESKSGNSTVVEPKVKRENANGADVYRAIVEQLDNEGIVAFHKWDVTGDDERETHYLLCLVSESKDGNFTQSKLSIYDDKKGLIYEEVFDPLYEIRSELGRMDCPPLLILEPNGGRNLEILGYDKGEVVNLFSDVAQSGFEIRPQFRSGDHTGEPFQVIVRSEGLNSPVEKFAEIYRYKDGKFRPVGKYSQPKVDDFIEKSLSK